MGILGWSLMCMHRAGWQTGCSLSIIDPGWWMAGVIVPVCLQSGLAKVLPAWNLENFQGAVRG